VSAITASTLNPKPEGAGVGRLLALSVADDGSGLACSLAARGLEELALVQAARTAAHENARMVQ